MVTLARGRWDGSKLVDVKDIFTAQATGNASRILFARDGTLIMSVGYGDPPQANQGNPEPDKMPPQDPMNLAGKTLRLKDDGTVPPTIHSWERLDIGRRFIRSVIATSWASR